MTIKAKFIGVDSLGYVNGNTYTLEVKGTLIRRTQGGGRCMYVSIQAFLKNWTDITHQL